MLFSIKQGIGRDDKGLTVNFEKNKTYLQYDLAECGCNFWENNAFFLKTSEKVRFIT